MINLVIKQILIVNIVYNFFTGVWNNHTINIMAVIEACNILYTLCNKYSKYFYDCNHFDYIINTKNETDTIPIFKEYKKECYSQLEILKV